MSLYHIDYPENTLKTSQNPYTTADSVDLSQDQLPHSYDFPPCHAQQSKHLRMHICIAMHIYLPPSQQDNLTSPIHHEDEFEEASFCLIIHNRIWICCCDACCKEAIWIWMFLGDILHSLMKLMVLYCDNQSAIAVAKNDQYHARTKHIDSQYHFIWNQLAGR